MYLKERQAIPVRPGVALIGTLSGLDETDEAEQVHGNAQASLGAAACLDRIANCITDFLFDLRHPERRRAPLPPLKAASPKDRILIQEWNRTRDKVVSPWIQQRKRDVQYELEETKRLYCGSIPRDLGYLENYLVIVSDPTKNIRTVDPAKDLELMRRGVERTVKSLTVSLEVYSAMGCTTPDLSSAKTRVEQMPWPKDQAMQDQRTKLVQAIQRAQQKT